MWCWWGWMSARTKGGEEEMATVNIKVPCGCGYTATNLEEAVRHADETGHTLTVLGTVKSNNRKE